MVQLVPIDDRQRRQRARNLALSGVLAALVLLFYIIALVRMGAWQ